MSILATTDACDVLDVLARLDAIPALERALSRYAPLQQAGLLAPLTAQCLDYPPFSQQQVQVDVLQADQLHPVISGNKWFKLKYNLLQALEDGCEELLSFGGAWSNHLHALAYLGGLMGVRTQGVVRGEEHTQDATPTLQDASRYGMALRFVSRPQFRDYRNQPRPLQQPGRWVIPEGGDNPLGMLGAASMVMQADLDWSRYSHLVVAVGTGCTFAGLRLALPSSVMLVGVSALKGTWVGQAMAERMAGLTDRNWQLDTSRHRGGFARVDAHLLSFMADFSDNTGIQLEPVYTGKALLALLEMIQARTIAAGSRVLFVHSGGLQGARPVGAEVNMNPRNFRE
ncbi:1-aminocyclopropane-1-carboxylate deaminase/D-cysteine desulfhydrase [Ketobacter sp.]|uniref:1-aminocyclopropane-1-carboxylate deaminase/D-cysteine desulfhydrase n=1 Tax=Ketobacter sp. TaxID=2083498 RepID=UPI000F240DB0|nr:pyridoxal-phosphate dependent enzyme [Ketobacter sp.]RLT93522.1 MAG: pyridoxal-phosphate dependent enzyme [Ketobacter sp.]